MPYRGAQSSARQRVEERERAIQQGRPPEPDPVPLHHREVIAHALDHGVSLNVAADVVQGGSRRTKTRTYEQRVGEAYKVQRPMRAELEHAGLSTRALARRIARAVAKMDHEDLQERYYGLKAANLALRLRGDLVTVPASGTQAPPQNLAVLIQVLNEIKASTPQDVVVEMESVDEKAANPAKPAD